MTKFTKESGLIMSRKAVITFIKGQIIFCEEKIKRAHTSANKQSAKDVLKYFEAMLYYLEDNDKQKTEEK